MCKQEMPALYEDMQCLLPLYAHAFPWKTQIRVTDSTNISTGWEGELFCVQLAYEEEGEQKAEEIILKLYYGQDGTRKAHSEFSSLQRLTAVGYPVPHPLFAALETSPFGRAAVAMEKIGGQTAAHLFEEACQEDRQALLRQCCQLYVALHALDWERVVPNPAGIQIKDVIHSRLAWARAVSDQWLPGVFDPVLAWLQERREAIPRQYVSIVHGDFHLDNLIMKDDGTLQVIDWTGTDVSDYRFDLAWTFLLQRTQGAADLAEAMQREYERLVGHDIEHFTFFEVLACFKRLFEITVSLKSGATTLGLKPEAEGEMKQQLDRMQAVYAQLQERIAHPLPEVERVMLTLGCDTSSC